MEENRVINRLDMFIKAKGLNDNKVTVKAGLANGAIGQARKGKCDIGKKYIDKILAAYPELSRVWLLTGDGEMLNHTPTISNTNSQSNSPITGNNNNVGSVFTNSHIQNGGDTFAIMEMLQEQQRQNAETQRQNAELQIMMKEIMKMIKNK